MIDIHSHILYNLDDGATDIEESISMAHEAYSSGVTDIICTPHYNKFNNVNFSKEIAIERLKLLQSKLESINCPIKLYIGNEIYLDDTFEDSLNVLGEDL